MTNDLNQPVNLVSVPNEIEAAAIVTMLSSHGIEALMTGGFTAGLRAEAPGLVHVVVRRKDLQEASQLLESADAKAPVDWSQVDVGEEET